MTVWRQSNFLTKLIRVQTPKVVCGLLMSNWCKKKHYYSVCAQQKNCAYLGMNRKKHKKLTIEVLQICDHAQRKTKGGRKYIALTANIESPYFLSVNFILEK